MVTIVQVSDDAYGDSDKSDSQPIQVIENGSASDAKVSGRILGGKTGTAEIKQSQDDNTGTELGWFVQFTADKNEENPLIIVSMVEDVKDRGGSHYVSTKVKTLFEINP